jgi:signal peptidase II
MKWTIPIVAATCLAADYATKVWANAALIPGSPSPFIPGLLRLTLTTNTGAAFGVGRQSAWLMTALALTILSAVLIWVIKRESSSEPPLLCERVGMGLLIGGAAGNILDRLVAGRVTDFIEFAFIDFPVFNLADACIDAGAVLILLKLVDSHQRCAFSQSVQPSAPLPDATTAASTQDSESPGND